MAITSDTKLVNLGNLQTFKAAYDTQVANNYLSKEEFLDDGIIKSAKLPSYVDDVIEIHVDKTDPENITFNLDDNGTLGAALTTGERGKIYFDIDASIDGYYRWSGSTFVPIGTSVSTADKAVKDASGNTITTTYATKSELTTATTTPATAASLGSVKIGDNIYVTNDGTISVAVASAGTLGVVKIGDNIDVDANGVVSVAIAGANTLGVVQGGDNVTIGANGVLGVVVATSSEVNGIFDSGE